LLGQFLPNTISRNDVSASARAYTSTAASNDEEHIGEKAERDYVDGNDTEGEGAAREEARGGNGNNDVEDDDSEDTDVGVLTIPSGTASTELESLAIIYSSKDERFHYVYNTCPD
jgi:hypothetical protein